MHILNIDYTDYSWTHIFYDDGIIYHHIIYMVIAYVSIYDYVPTQSYTCIHRYSYIIHTCIHT